MVAPREERKRRVGLVSGGDDLVGLNGNEDTKDKAHPLGHVFWDFLLTFTTQQTNFQEGSPFPNRGLTIGKCCRLVAASSNNTLQPGTCGN